MSDLVLSLFPGIGLLDMAFEAEDFAVVAGPDVCWGRDIRDFHPPAGRFDGIIGGPPCQPFSPLVHLVRANGREPKHGNLIPEYERVVAEACPTWFLMEEVPQAPLPVVDGYAVHSFVLDNCTLDGGEGIGLAQMRKRRFSFGVAGASAPDLRRWIAYAALELPNVRLAVTRDPREVPVAVGGSGQTKARVVTADYDSGVQYGHEHTTIAKARAVVARELAASSDPNGRVARWQASGHDQKAPPSARVRGRSWKECCALQGLPADFLSEAPFTKSGKFTVLGNGVPIPMGRAIARAIKQVIAL